MKSVAALVEACRENGLRLTPQRRAIFELLVEDDSHPTAEEVYRRVRPVMPDVSRTTVYNTLHELVAIGELSPVDDLSAGEMRYDTDSGDHHHLFCTQCHALVDIHREFANVDLPPADAAGYKIVKRQVTFYGICPECQAARGAEPETAAH
jgi:Fur family transcriptional regulator, peroxide stress response regulator